VSASVEVAAVVITAAATVVLAFATFWAVMGADRTARAAERTLALQTRAVLLPAHMDDPPQRIVFQDSWWLKPGVAGGRAVLEVEDSPGRIYMGIALRNVGLGLALLYGWHLYLGLRDGEDPPEDSGAFIGQSRSLHVPPGGVGFWQALPTEKKYPETVTMVRDAVEVGKPLTVDLLYGNEEGGQGRITRFHLRPLAEASAAKSERSCEVARHWNIDTLGGSWPKQEGKLRLRTRPDAPGA
jgi:hypothetical protein